MFISDFEKKISDQYLNDGYIINDIKEKDSLKYIQDFFINSIKGNEKFQKNKIDINDIFNNTHKFINTPELNDFRIEMIKKLYDDENIKFHYYNLSKELLHVIVGNELSMQRRISLSIQLPKDDSSLLSVHADTWSGDSSYEVVVWLPLVNCYKTKSMFILPPKKNYIVDELFLEYKNLSSSKLYEEIKEHLTWLTINEGQYLIFNQNLPHGNIVNQENETRWSMNCRFKSLFTPYAEKKLGEFFEPITLKSASMHGMKYKLPKTK